MEQQSIIMVSETLYMERIFGWSLGMGQIWVQMKKCKFWRNRQAVWDRESLGYKYNSDFDIE